MPRGEYRVVNGVTRSIKNSHRVSGGAVRKIAKQWRCSSGVVRQFYPSSKVSLYSYGNTCDQITGGYTSATAQNALDPSGSGWSGVPTMSLESDHILISIPDQQTNASSRGNMAGIWTTTNMINLADYNKLYIKFEVTFGNTTQNVTDKWCAVAMGASLTRDFTNFSNGYVARWNYQGNTGIVTWACDVSAIAGSRYISLFAVRDLVYISDTADDSVTFKVYEMWLD